MDDAEAVLRSVGPKQIDPLYLLFVVLILIAYGPFFATYLPPNFVSPGFRFF